MAAEAPPPVVVSQDPSAPPARPWAVGFVPAAGSGSGKALALRREVVTLDIDDKDSSEDTVDGDVDFYSTGLEYSLTAGACLFRFQLASVSCDSERQGTDSTGGVLGGFGLAFPFTRLGRFAWGGDYSLRGGQVDWDQYFYGETSVGWFQHDLRTALAYVPSPTSRAGLSPRLGLGLRVVDGIQDLGGGGTTDFDAVAPYVMGGFGAHVRTGEKSRLVFDLHGMVGDMHGVDLAISFQF